MTPEMKEFLEGQFAAHKGSFDAFVAKATAQLKEMGEWKGAMHEDLRELAQKVNGNAYGDSRSSTKSIGDLITGHDEFKQFSERKARRSEKIFIKSFFPEQKALSRDGSAGDLVVPMRVPGILMPGQERLTIRDLLRVSPTTSNAVQFVKEVSFTNNAAIVYDSSPSPNGRREGITKPESSMEFTEDSQMVETIAHWIPASKQILDDVPALRAYVDGRMRYGLKLKEEDELLNGDGTPGHLNGLVNQASEYDTSLNVAGDTPVDKLGHALAQVEDESDLEADGIVLNNLDWAAIRQTKNSGDGAYTFVNPQGMTIPALWGKLVVPTKRMARGKFLVGAFRMGADLWDREQASVEISREHSDFFTRNLAAILCEERLALTVGRPQAFVYGSL